MLKNLFSPIINFFSGIVSSIKEEMKIPIEESLKFDTPKLKSEAIYLHPLSLFELSIRLWKEGKKEESLKWYYIGALRYRVRLDALEKDNNGTLSSFNGEFHQFEKFEFETKPVFLEWAGGNPEGWAEKIEEALKWDRNNFNFHTSKSKYSDIYESNINNMRELKKQLIEKSEDMLKEREKNNMKNGW